MFIIVMAVVRFVIVDNAKQFRYTFENGSLLLPGVRKVGNTGNSVDKQTPISNFYRNHK